jgi:hypothetical protein
VDIPPWFADDPVARGDVPEGRQLVSPVGTGDLRWEVLAEGDFDLAEWCAERWLGPYRRLAVVPAQLTETRKALHRLAEEVISPARARVNGKIGLRYTRGGFGTPFFGAGVQLRVAGGELVTQSSEDVQTRPLDVDPVAGAFIGDVFGFAASVLEELRAGDSRLLEPSRVQLWPEHFDMSVELGSEQARAAYGVSPGDAEHPEPYLYVAPWVAPPPGALWNATGFTGAELSYSELLDADDQRSAAIDFFARRLTALVPSPPV